MFPTIALPRGVRQVGPQRFRAQIRDQDGKLLKLSYHGSPDAAHAEFVTQSMAIYGNSEARLPDGVTRKQQREQRREHVADELQRTLCSINEHS